MLKDTVLSDSKLLPVLSAYQKAQSVLPQPQNTILFAFICTDVTVNVTALVMVIRICEHIHQVHSLSYITRQDTTTESAEE